MNIRCRRILERIKRNQQLGEIDKKKKTARKTTEVRTSNGDRNIVLMEHKLPEPGHRRSYTLTPNRIENIPLQFHWQQYINH